MSRPVAVIISDVHYSLQTLELADAALRQALKLSRELSIPLIVSGDLHDSKANMRAEVVNRMIETFKTKDRLVIILRGNHDQINEKSQEHALNFLTPYVTRIISDPMRLDDQYFIPYQHDIKKMRQILSQIPSGSQIIMHQGIEGSNSGEYYMDKSALSFEDVKDFRVISGHYHARQDIKTGHPRKGAVGLFSYVGNPYTLNFGEANDPEKGFQILMDDGTLEFIPTNLRKHIIYEWDLTKEASPLIYNKEDLLWMKISGPREWVEKITKKDIAIKLNLEIPFKLDLIPLKTDFIVEKKSNITQGELLDQMIDSMKDTSDEKKLRLKELWKSSVSN